MDTKCDDGSGGSCALESLIDQMPKNNSKTSSMPQFSNFIILTKNQFTTRGTPNVMTESEAHVHYITFYILITC